MVRWIARLALALFVLGLAAQLLSLTIVGGALMVAVDLHVGIA